MEPSYLDVDELNYELVIRGFAKTLNMRMGTKVLREALLKESKGELDPPGMTDSENFDLEFKIASSKLDEIDKSLVSNILRLSPEEVKQIETKLRHIKGRLERLLNNESCNDDVGFLIERARGFLDRLFLKKRFPEAKNNPSLDVSKNINTLSSSFQLLDEAAGYQETTKGSKIGSTNEESDLIDVMGDLSDFNIMGGEERSIGIHELNKESYNQAPLSVPQFSSWGISPIPNRDTLLRTVQDKNFLASIPNQITEPNPSLGAIPKVSVNNNLTSSTLNDTSYISAINRTQTPGQNNGIKNVHFRNTPEIIRGPRNLFPANKPQLIQPPRLTGQSIRPMYQIQKHPNVSINQNHGYPVQHQSSGVRPTYVTNSNPNPSYYDGIFSKQPVVNSNLSAHSNYNQFFPVENRLNNYPEVPRQVPNIYENYNHFFPEAYQRNHYPEVPRQMQQFQEPGLDVQDPEQLMNRPQGARCRYRSPVASWNLVFSGNSSGKSLNDFLSQVQMYARADGVSNLELLRAAVYLFTGPALTWYRAYGPRLVSWEHLVQTLRQEFLPYDYDYGLLREIEQRKQGKGESFAMFLANMEMMYRGLQYTIVPEQQMIDTIMRNLLPYYAEKLVMCHIVSIRDLSLYCRRIENFQFRMNKQSDNVSPLLEPQFAYRGKPIQKNFINAIEENSEPLAIVPRHTARVSCFNCQGTDHDHKNCPSPKLRIFCYNCGELGQLATFCCKCNPNSENRMRDITPKGRGQYPQQRH